MSDESSTLQPQSQSQSQPQSHGPLENHPVGVGVCVDKHPVGTRSLLDMSENGELDGDRTKALPNNCDIVLHQAQRIRELEEQLAMAKSNATVETLSNQSRNKEDGDLLMELERKLQRQMASKAETENQLRLARRQISDLQTHGQEQTAEFEKYRGLEETLKQAMEAKDEAQFRLTSALERLEDLVREKSELEERIEKLQQDVTTNRETISSQEQELQKLRDQRDEQERKVMSLTSRLNSAKKKEAGKSNEAERYEEELTTVTTQLEKLKYQVDELSATKERLQKELEETIVSSRQRQVQTEAALEEERRLNEDRKTKMKLFIEKKMQEIRQAKADNEALQLELNQSTRSLSDLNIRWKQLHAQWVQSQTRNRELQRDLHRIKKDSENLHKVGDTLEMKLSKSATETEEHKNKRLAAKNELMTVLHTLQVEREITARLRDSIKFTFTPKALSQQQLLNETLQDLEEQLVKLSIRLRKTLTPPTDEAAAASNSHSDSDWMEDMSDNDHDNNKSNSNSNSNSVGTSRADLDTHRLIEKLNRETQQVSKCIMALVTGIERLHLLLDSTGDRSCYTVVTELVGRATGTGTHVHVPVSTTNPREEREFMTGTSPHLRSITNRNYHD